MSRWLVLKVMDSLSQRSGTQINTDDRRWMLEIHMGLLFGHSNKPFDSTQGHESFDYAQDPEVLEG